MAWFKVDDGFHSSRKVLSIPRRSRLAAIGAWTIAGAWCAGPVGLHPRENRDPCTQHTGGRRQRPYVVARQHGFAA